MANNYYHSLKPAVKKQIIFEPIQLLNDPEFSIGHLNETPWTSVSGWGSNLYPVILNGSLNFTYALRIVHQTVNINNFQSYSNLDLTFSVKKHSMKTSAQSVFYVTLELFDIANNLIYNLRYPETGDAQAQTNWTEYNINTDTHIGDVKSAKVSIVARETGNWAGQYGPQFDYCRLILS
jgi:hypothetical protein